MLQQIDLCKFQPTSLHLWTPLEGTNKQQKKYLQQARKTHIAKDLRVM